LSSIFSGKRDLFNGLAIDSLPYDWKPYPVIMFSFAGISATTPAQLESGIVFYLQEVANENQIILPENLTPGQMLQKLVIELSRAGRVVLLIDEYDYSILKHIHDPKMAHEIREVLKNFYAVIKDLDRYLKFCLLTGVSKFSQASIFSGLNNLNDISFDAPYNALLGYTHDEIVIHFQQYLEQAASYHNCSVENLLSHITEWYDGY
jgi:hypothetical protein